MANHVQNSVLPLLEWSLRQRYSSPVTLQRLCLHWSAGTCGQPLYLIIILIVVWVVAKDKVLERPYLNSLSLFTFSLTVVEMQHQVVWNCV